MDIHEKVSLLQELVACCDAISTWCYDAKGELLFSNCTDETVLNTAFSAFGCRSILMEHTNIWNNPFLLGTSLGLVWGAAFEREDGVLRRFWLLGPVFYATTTKGQIELGYDLYRGLELSVAWKEQFMQAAARLPVVTNVLLGRYLLMLHYCLTGQTLHYSDIVMPTELLRPAKPAEPTKRDRYQVYAAERALLDMVRNGDLNYAEAFSNSSLLSSGVPVSGPDPLRQVKSSITVFTSLVCRAAIEGGVSPEEAYSLGDAYIQRAENARSQQELLNLPATMYDDFIHRVHRCRTNPRYSQAVQKCIDYIELHLEERIRAADLARQTGYDEYYLTHRFKKETGYAVSDYVRFAKIERAKVLLSSTALSVQEIADKLGFSSRSYFIRSFRGVTGQTPSAWRNTGGQT